MENILDIYISLRKDKNNKFLMLIIAFSLLLNVFVLTGCEISSQSVHSEVAPKIQHTSTDSELAKNRSLWREAKISNYDFVSTKFGGGIYGWVPVLIQVRDNKATSMEPARKREQLERIDGYDELNTVEKLFDKIQEAYDKEYSVNVTYNKEFGYPETTAIDDLKTSDSGFSLEISSFKIVKAE